MNVLNISIKTSVTFGVILTIPVTRIKNCALIQKILVRYNYKQNQNLVHATNDITTNI